MNIWFLSLLASGSVRSSVIPNPADNNKARENDTILTIPKLGTLRGKVTETFFTGRKVYQYLGISYARSPSKRLRFQAPQMFPPWEGLYLADRMRQQCPQIDLTYYPSLDPSQIDQKDDLEDCLVVNVFTPKPSQTQRKLLPVLFYIHGGSFYAGSAYDFLPDFLLEKDIVLVVVQYRLGPLGFLSLQNDSIPGNAGMLDMILALEWVQENIVWFGGDASKVTIVGQSAGGAAVSSLLVSPLTRNRDLFSQVIVQSGSVISPWAVAKDPVSSALRIAKLSGCPSQERQDIADCLRKVPVNDLIEAHQKFLIEAPHSKKLDSNNLVIQKAGGHRKFLDKDPNVLLQDGNFLKVPIMGGTTRDEGTAFVGKIVRYFYGDGSIPDHLVEMYSNAFFNNADNIQEATPGMIDLAGLIPLKAPTNQIVRQMAPFKPAFLYSFNFLGNVSKFRASIGPRMVSASPYPIGVTHSDELGYLFPMAYHKYTSRELDMVKTMVDLWTNFVIQGSPSPTAKVPAWPKMSTSFGPYLEIDQTSVVKDNIYEQYRINQMKGYKENSAQVLPISVVISFFTTAAVLLIT